MNKTAIVLVGQGKLANAVRSSINRYLDNCIVDVWENTNAIKERKIIVHIGSGRQLKEVIDYCNATGIPLIQGSTGVEYEYNDGKFVFIDAPNFNTLLLKFMHMLNWFGENYKGNRIEITESHQKIKQSVPGTAVAIAKYLGVHPKEIKSVRELDTQINDYKIPAEYIDQHAMHIIKITNEDTSITMRTDVMGLESYVAGLASILSVVNQLEKRLYHVVELIEMKLI